MHHPLRNPSRLIRALKLTIEPVVMPAKSKAENRPRSKESSIDGVTQSIERLVLGAIDPHTNDLARPGEGNVETRRQRSGCGAANIIGDPGTKSRKASEYARSAEAQEDISDGIALVWKACCLDINWRFQEKSGWTYPE